MAELRKSYSNYVLRKKRQLTSKGSLYERDWMTVSELDGFAPGTLPVYASGNFKMTINNTRSGKKKYSFSNWALNDCGDTQWDLTMIKEEELKITSDLIKPNYSSILDFAYYGSAVELIHGTANDLAVKYPAEIYCRESGDVGYSMVTGDTDGELEYLTNIVENPFGIDIWSAHVKPEKVENQYRYMCLSHKKYEIIDGDAETGTPVTSWTPATYTAKKKCLENGDVVFSGATINDLSFKGIYINGDVYIVCTEEGKHIRLQKKYIDEVFESFDDFEKVLLDRDSIPMYKAKFYTPRETDRGVITHEKAYVWPTLSGKWNIDMQTGAYESYINGLLYIANYYDEIRADNIWRSYTHESIKNFDWTTPRDTYVPEMDGHLIDTERLAAMMRVCGRQFDDLKRYIENIKFTVNVSYDSKNNMPDEAMGKFLEMSGWEVKNVSPVNNNELIQDVLYPGRHVRCNPEDANKEFLKRMILNSRNILSKKGTRAGIEAMYSMFGLFDMKYGETIEYCGSTETIGFTIEEFDVLAKSYISGETVDEVYEVNKEKNDYTTRFERTWSDYVGLLAEEKFIINGIRFLVPWYEIDYEYDGYPYFQMMGGWAKKERKDILLPDLASGITEIFTDNIVGIYDETVKNVKVIESIQALNDIPIGYLEEGDIYYVLNLLGTPKCDTGDYSHYVFFAAVNGEPDFVGDTVSYNDEYMWCLVENSEFNVPTEELSWYAKEILYIESIHDNSNGNNPHDGKQKYDDGREYFEYYEKLFKGAFDNDMFSDYRARIANENARRIYENRFRAENLPSVRDETGKVEEVGFELKDFTGMYDCESDYPHDNTKIWFFLSDDNGIYESTPSDYSGSTLYGRLVEKYNNPGYFKPESDLEKLTDADFPLKYRRIKGETTENFNAPIRDTGSTIPFVEETLQIEDSIKSVHEEGPDETWSYSVINTKNVRITYYLPWELEDYVTNVVEFYVKQLIPSTVMVSFCWKYTADGKRPAGKIPYASIKLTPAYQRIRSYETTADIDIKKINVDGVGILRESTETRE